MGLVLSSDALIEELNTLDLPSEKKLLRGLETAIKKTTLFLGLWNATANTPNITTLQPQEGSFMKVIEATEISIIGPCKSNDWIIYLSGSWNVLPLTLTEIESDVLNINAPNTIAVKKSDTTTDGYLSSTDWNTFNNKQEFIANNLSYLDSISNSSTVIMSARAIQQLVGGGSNSSLLPNALWDPIADKPQIRDGSGIVGYNYYVLRSATVNIGSGVRNFTAGQIISYNVNTLRWE